MSSHQGAKTSFQKPALGLGIFCCWLTDIIIYYMWCHITYCDTTWYDLNQEHRHYTMFVILPLLWCRENGDIKVLLCLCVYFRVYARSWRGCWNHMSPSGVWNTRSGLFICSLHTTSKYEPHTHTHTLDYTHGSWYPPVWNITGKVWRT